ncbi:MAG: sensor histidine kinase [Opitutales bacterium]
MIISSIRVRIQIWHTSLLAFLVGGLLTAFYFHEKEIRLRELDTELSGPVIRLTPHVISIPSAGIAPGSARQGKENFLPPPRLQGQQGPEGRSPMGPGNRRHDSPHRKPLREERATTPRIKRGDAPLDSIKSEIIRSGRYVIAWDGEGNEVIRTDNAPKMRTRPELEQPDGKNQTKHYSRTLEKYREYIHVGRPGHIILLGKPIEELKARLYTLKLQLVAIWTVVVALGFGVGWILVARLMKPVENISNAAREIANGDLSRRIDTDETESELGQLAEVLNETFEKLEHSFGQQVRFTADASHELRTPVSVILAKCQFALRRDRDVEKYKQTFEECEISAQHIRRLVESLLELARVDSGEFKLQYEETDVTSVVKDCVFMLGALAEEKSITIENELKSVVCSFDRARIHQVFINLLSNAINYTPDGGRVKVLTFEDGTHCIIAFEDNGIGIDAEHLPNLFERFYRASKERDERKSTGLGLAITKAIVDAHGGQIRVESELNKGSRFEVRLPKKPSKV